MCYGLGFGLVSLTHFKFPTRDADCGLLDKISTMVLLEVEQKFSWTAAKLRLLQHNQGRPPFKQITNLRQHAFRDTYYDSQHRLSEAGLWVRKRHQILSPENAVTQSTFEWEAKQRRDGSSVIRSTFEETKDTYQIAQMVRAHVSWYPSSYNDFGLDELCQFETCRRSFEADGKFTVVLDSTDFGHQVGEVEILAEDAEKAHRDIDAFMREYAWFFDIIKPKGKLTAYFEKFGYPNESPELSQSSAPSIRQLGH